MVRYDIINKSELQRALNDNLPEFAALSETQQKSIVKKIANHMGSIIGFYTIVEKVERILSGKEC